MIESLKEMKDNATIGDFLFPGLSRPIKGKVTSLKDKRVVIESDVGGKTYQYITHPDNVCVVQVKQ